jgi:hypothetical protein
MQFRNHLSDEGAKAIALCLEDNILEELNLVIFVFCFICAVLFANVGLLCCVKDDVCGAGWQQFR